MNRELERVALGNGECLDIRVVEAPDEEFGEVVMGLLSHKGELRSWHIREAFAGRTPGLRNLFYAGFIDGTPVGNITLWESGPVGDIGHVYTAEDHRRKGICRAIMGAQMGDFRNRQGRYLVLGTGYDSHPYHIYHSFGFRSMQPKSGSMNCLVDADFFADYFSPSKVSCDGMQWKDWGPVCALMALPHGDLLREKGRKKFGRGCHERELTEDFFEMGRGEKQVRVGRTETGAVVGYAILRPDGEWAGETWLLDLFVHPDFPSCTGELVEGFTWPSSKVLCYMDTGSPRREGLERAGFSQEGVLKDQLRVEGKTIDLLIMGKD